MNDSQSDTTPNATPNAHHGFRIAVGAVGLALLALFVILGSVAMKQSVTAEALEKRESLHEDAQSAPARE